MGEIIYSSIRELVDLLKKRKISVVELTKLYLQQIEEVNPELNAIVQKNEDVLKMAKEKDKNFEKYSKKEPLFGIPITIKDSIDTAGIITTGGTKGRKGYIPEKDATVVKKLKEAGAIILGKTNTPELTLEYETMNEIYGKTNNPYNIDKSPGGSSGGEAAAIAAGCSAFGIGSDTAGSIRLPAHFCGISGLKPTKGRVPATGCIIPNDIGLVDELTQLGPLTRYVNDLNLVMDVIHGPDGSDPNCVPVGWPEFINLNNTELKGIYYLDNEIYELDEEVRESILKTVEFLKNKGIKIIEKKPPELDKTFSLFKKIFSADGWTWKYRLLEKYGTIDKLKENPKRAINGIEFNELIGKLQRFRKKNLEFMKDYDFIISPVTAFAARDHGFSYDEKGVIAAFSYTMVYNLLGWPAVSIRVSETDDNLPIGVQLASTPWREDVCLSLAQEIENEFGGWVKPQI
ncbi:MAG: amidase [Bacillota bacterium]